MKKLSLFLTFLFFSSFCFGQFSLGPKAGINFHTVTGKWSSEDDTKNKFIVGPVLGVVGNYAFNETFALSGELTYETMGQKNIFTLNEKAFAQSQETYLLTERWNCLAFAALATVIIGNWVALGGIFTRFKMAGNATDGDGNRTKLRMGEGDQKSSEPIQYVDPDYNRRWDFGMYIGGGYGRQVGPGKLVADLRFGYGFLDLNKFENKEQKQNAKDNGYKGYHSMNISLSVAYMFQLGKK